MTIFATLSRDFSTTKVVFIPAGSNAAIITHLANYNFNVSSLDRYILAVLGRPQAGWIDIGVEKLSKADFLYRLTTAKAATTPITLIPGETTAYFLRQVATELGLDFARLLAAVELSSPIKEGFLIPETYNIPRGISERHLASYLTAIAKNEHKKRALKIFGAYDEKKWFLYLTTASIIQKEAANAQEMPIVASVIYNRLNKNMRLQMDGTLNYGLFSHTPVTSERIKSDNSPFNTYKNSGLPPSPVCVVSLDAIRAAIFPKKSDYLYFVKDRSTGKHTFSKNYGDHLSRIKNN